MHCAGFCAETDAQHQKPLKHNAPPTVPVAVAVDPRSFTTFAELYPFYLGEHGHRTRRLHFLGSTLALLCLGLRVATGKPPYFLHGLLAGCGCAWIGCFEFEKNKPASFKRPLCSFIGDWVMYRDPCTGKIPF